MDDLKLTINKLQDELESAISQITKKHQLDSIILTDISVTTGSANIIPHKLGRKYSGWRVVDRTAASVIYRDTSTGQSTSKFIALNTTVNDTISLEVW